jgi:NADPH2:quinone reductase
MVTVVSFQPSTREFSAVEEAPAGAAEPELSVAPALNTYTATRGEFEASAGAVFTLVAKGVLIPRIHARYALADVAKAHADLEAGRTIGSSILIP